MGFNVLDPDYENNILSNTPNFTSSEGALRGYLCNISLPQLANPPDNLLPCHETVDDTAYVNDHISARIHAYFQQLSEYAARDDIKVASEDFNLIIEIATQTFDITPDCKHRHFHARRLKLQRPEALQELPFVHTLALSSKPSNTDVESQHVRPLSLLTPFQCLAALPNITTLRLPWMWERPLPYPTPSKPLAEMSRPWEGPLRDARHEFGNAMGNQDMYLRGRQIPSSLKNAMLYFWQPKPIAEEDQGIARPNLIHPADRDPVSVGLCRLARQLEILDLRALITPDVFPSPDDDDEGIQWLNMQRFRIEFHPLGPDGRWYFVGPRGEDPHDSRDGGWKIGDKDYPREHDIAEDKEMDKEYDLDPNGGREEDTLVDMFRVEPCRERVEPLLAAFAKAVAEKNMPQLKDAELCAWLWWDPSHERRGGEEGYGYEDEYDGPYAEQLAEDDYADGICHRWGVKYLTERCENGEDDEEGDEQLPRVQWQVGDWRPSPEVMSLFEALGPQEWLDFEVFEGRSEADGALSTLF